MGKLEELVERRQRVLDEFQELGDFRRGSLIKRYIACGKAGCCCTTADHPGHGPKYSLTYKVKSKTRTEYVPAEGADQVVEQLREHKRFLLLCRQLVELNDQICRLRLPEEGKKKLRTRKGAPSRSKP